MHALIMQILRSRWFAVTVHLALWLLLFLCARNIGGKVSEFRDTTAAFLPTQALAPVARLEPLFRPATAPNPLGTNLADMFATRHFIPPPTPPAPPPPSTKKIPVTYLGFYEAANAPRSAVIKLPEGFRTIPAGKQIVTNFFVAEARLQLLVVTNQGGQTNLLPVNTPKELEVPIK